MCVRRGDRILLRCARAIWRFRLSAYYLLLEWKLSNFLRVFFFQPSFLYCSALTIPILYVYVYRMFHFSIFHAIVKFGKFTFNWMAECVCVCVCATLVKFCTVTAQRATSAHNCNCVNPIKCQAISWSLVVVATLFALSNWTLIIFSSFKQTPQPSTIDARWCRCRHCHLATLHRNVKDNKLQLLLMS